MPQKDHNETGQQLVRRVVNELLQNPSNDCIEWPRQKGLTGYGYFKSRGKNIRVHRFAHEVAYGAIPPGLLVLHRCDNPSCFNPAHLFLGTHDENMADRSAKGRQARGDKHGRKTHPERVSHGVDRHTSKLSEAQVREIRALHANGMPQLHIAPLFGVTVQNIHNIVHRRYWKHLL